MESQDPPRRKPHVLIVPAPESPDGSDAEQTVDTGAAPVTLIAGEVSPPMPVAEIALLSDSLASETIVGVAVNGEETVVGEVPADQPSLESVPVAPTAEAPVEESAATDPPERETVPDHDEADDFGAGISP